MEYFVSAENTSYHHWQLELLIESFKLQNLQDNLVIGLAENDEEKLVDFGNNLKTARRIFSHENIGSKRGYLPLNRPYSLYTAISRGLIKQPFTLIDPDMILVVPVKVPKENIKFQLKPLFTREYVSKNCPIDEPIKELLKSRSVEDVNIDYWIPLGNVIVFNNVPEDFFVRVIEWTETLEYERRKKTAESWWHTEKAAWVMTLLEYNGHITYDGNYDMEMSLLDNNKANNFIHYAHGLPPAFSKLMYKFQPPYAFAMGDLFEVLLENNPTTSTNYLQHVVRSYLPVKPINKPLDLKEFKVERVVVKSKN